MNGLTLLMMAMGMTAFAAWVVNRGLAGQVEQHTLEMPDVEALRASLIRHTGVQIGELAIMGGNWQALTAYGWMPVSELLGRAKHGDLVAAGGAK